MCGIAGIFQRKGGPVEPLVLEQMARSLAHRGPDDVGTYVADGLGLVHRRLSIIDLSGGHQPIVSGCGRCVLIFNGEIYNFAALREELMALGHAFQTRSDTEVILIGYLQFGDAIVERLEGMFAFALWDRRERKLLLARDRFGMKPLYIYDDGNRIGFASEIKALLKLPGFERSWDDQALHDYFTLLYVPVGRSIYRSIRELRPGHVAILKDNVLRDRCYWSLRPAALTPEAAVTALQEHLGRSVREHTVADVPVAGFLSGGIDSGLLVAHLSRALPDRVNTFNVYDPDVKFYDERSRAREIAQRFGTRHSEVAAKTQIQELWREFAGIFDEPFADSGAVSSLVVSRAARAQTKVALSGLGGDELFGGYRRYLAFLLSRRFPRLPERWRRLLVRMTDRVPDAAGPAAEWAKRLARLIGLEDADVYTGLLSSSGRLGERVFTREFLSRVDESSPTRQIDDALMAARDLGLDPLNRVLYADVMTYLPGDLLRCTDRTSMATGLEVRVPFLDRQLVELAFAIPGNLKVRRGRLKWILRRVAGEVLPASVVWGPKRGFGVPMADWLRGPLAPYVEVAIAKLPETEVLDAAAVRRVWDAHRSGRRNHEDFLWSVLMFCNWAACAR